ncbi:tetratricopeptide repeat protein [Sphingomonas oryzagri]|uniref:Tetratricopeptide repeat protein n=1 Tax=Sphingomonas oryzagri TaxID=3042314 RepID=A0ABT6N2G3_9SPHN|nr:tetratricopeptide repeat protein [Sphingomonas oryzagri]MDH7639475.1 tetratricopeptide repeat protein [Sphingomonas oryzagri]
MALTPVNNEAFIREVDEEVRREQTAKLARRYGVIVGVIVLLALAAFGGTLWWRAHQASVAAERGDAFMAAMASISGGKDDDAKKQLATIAGSGAEGYAPLSRMLQADLLVRERKDKEGADAFLKLSQDGSVPQPLRDVALVRATTIQFDTLPPQQVIDRLKPLAQTGNPWFGSAGEMTGLAWMKLNQPKKAGELFVAMTKDKSVPASLRMRVGQLAADLGYEAVQPQDMPAS